MEWSEFSDVFGVVGPTVVVLAVVILNGRDRLVNEVDELSERMTRVVTRLDGMEGRLANIEGILVGRDR